MFLLGAVGPKYDKDRRRVIFGRQEGYIQITMMKVLRLNRLVHNEDEKGEAGLA